MVPAGGNYSTVKKRIENFQIDISHFLGKGSNKNRNFGPKRDISEYLLNKHPISSSK